ncbi:MAG: hypothetical protein IJT51_07430 [Bacteroidales bacterium]|nr:hypothetical protein [Bacteroidales bacterium]
MPTKTPASLSRIDRILMLISSMSARQQQELEMQLKRLLLLMKAEKLKKSVEKNNITIKEIVKEVNKVCDGK